jgi:hypothetical protein
MTIDVIDATNPSDDIEIKTLRSTGINPIVIYGTSGAVEQVTNDIIQRAARLGTIELLRFHGHGIPGVMSIGCGGVGSPDDHNGLSVWGLRPWSHSQTISTGLLRLKPYFGSRGRVELHGCSTGMGHIGQTLLLRLSSLWGVPVSAGTETQTGGCGQVQFTFEGPVTTARPDGSLQSGLP